MVNIELNITKLDELYNEIITYLVDNRFTKEVLITEFNKYLDIWRDKNYNIVRGKIQDYYGYEGEIVSGLALAQHKAYMANCKKRDLADYEYGKFIFGGNNCIAKVYYSLFINTYDYSKTNKLYDDFDNKIQDRERIKAEIIRQKQLEHERFEKKILKIKEESPLYITNNKVCKLYIDSIGERIFIISESYKNHSYGGIKTFRISADDLIALQLIGRKINETFEIQLRPGFGKRKCKVLEIHFVEN